MPQLPKTRIKLTFDQWPGIEVEAGSITLDKAFALDDAERGDQLDALAAVLRGWNLTDGPQDEPVPCTREGLGSLEIGHAMVIFRAWIDAITDVPAPLDPPSSNGAPSGAAPFVPTEVL